ncbi:hypothetical protein [Paraburkholderia humisilvae]|uniref:Uncharacterized protein n=1 Tax=Paraburkholderia humisilvae TaxID=627669 RepID=A0A6J5DPX8_9BURK|nr:hypothetical protein [Paraburkholderia humisilvae]CAB3754906.1 hypothetical protein LMG29542_02485 [Paraburkholderia humisilvae]
MDQTINIFLDPPTQGEIDEALRQDNARISKSRDRGLTLGEKIALGPGVLGLEVLVGAAVDAFNGRPQQATSSSSVWEAWMGSLDWDWTQSMFTDSYAKKVRVMGRQLVRCEVTALAHQLSFEREAASVGQQAGRAVTALKDAGTIAGNIVDTIVPNVFRKDS